MLTDVEEPILNRIRRLPFMPTASIEISAPSLTQVGFQAMRSWFSTNLRFEELPWKRGADNLRKSATSERHSETLLRAEGCETLALWGYPQA